MCECLFETIEQNQLSSALRIDGFSEGETLLKVEFPDVNDSKHQIFDVSAEHLSHNMMFSLSVT